MPPVKLFFDNGLLLGASGVVSGCPYSPTARTGTPARSPFSPVREPADDQRERLDVAGDPERARIHRIEPHLTNRSGGQTLAGRCVASIPPGRSSGAAPSVDDTESYFARHGVESGDRPRPQCSRPSARAFGCLGWGQSTALGPGATRGAIWAGVGFFRAAIVPSRAIVLNGHMGVAGDVHRGGGRDPARSLAGLGCGGGWGANALGRSWMPGALTPVRNTVRRSPTLVRCVSRDRRARSGLDSVPSTR